MSVTFLNQAKGRNGSHTAVALQVSGPDYVAA